MIQNPLDSGYYESSQLRRFGLHAVGQHVRVARNATLVNPQNIRLGSHVRIDSGAILIATHPVTIGNYVHIAAHVQLSASVAEITLEDFAGLSHGACLYTSSDDFHGPYFSGPVVPSRYTNPTKQSLTIKKHGLVGTHSVILPGCDLDVGTAIGALSLVSKPTNPWTLYFGTPAKPIRARQIIDPDGTIEKTLLAEL